VRADDDLKRPRMALGEAKDAMIPLIALWPLLP
jgi:hypothetical protein